MSFNRRGFLGALLASAGLANGSDAAAQHVHVRDPEAPGRPDAGPGRFWRPRSGIVPVETPDVPKMPWRMENGVKVFHLVAEPVRTRVPARPPGRRVGLQRQRARARRSRSTKATASG